MRIIKEKTLWEYCRNGRYSVARASLQVWIYLVRYSEWRNPADLKSRLKSASIIGAKRVVFNIKGNEFRLVVDVEYKHRIVYVVWFGAHTEYDVIDVKTIRYGG
ncbi:MAG: type II toxin-antitoxin system HigB family toxin [Bacteroidales bacterium]|nr:type II toxin-antitoxin system HigB family toxin [Bacteroidales bacterium]